jgi:hypothetical protein
VAAVLVEVEVEKVVIPKERQVSIKVPLGKLNVIRSVPTVVGRDSSARNRPRVTS